MYSRFREKAKNLVVVTIVTKVPWQVKKLFLDSLIRNNVCEFVFLGSLFAPIKENEKSGSKP